MNRNRNHACHKFLVCSLSLPLTALALTGCSSGSSTSTPHSSNSTANNTSSTSGANVATNTPVVADTNTTLRTATLNTIHSLAATGGALALLLQAPSRAARTTYANPLRLFTSWPVSSPTRATQLAYLSALNLYDSTARNGQAFSYSFFSDAAGTQPAGSATLTIPATTDTYPYSTAVQFNITGGNYPGSGAGSLTYTSSSTIDIAGKLHLNTDASDAQLTLGLGNDANGKPVFTGNASIVTSKVNVQITNFHTTSDTGPGATLLGATMTVQPTGYTGSFDISNTTLTVQLTSGTKTFKATMITIDANGNAIQNPTLILTYPDGSQQTIPNAQTTPAK